MAELWVFLQSVSAHWIAIVGVILTLTPFVPNGVRKWVEEKVVKKEFSLKHLWILGALLLLIAFYETWQDEYRHSQQLMRENSSIAADRDNWKQQSGDKDISLRKRDDLLGQSVTAFTGLSNKILDITKPEPLKITVAGERLPYYDYGGSQPHEMMMLGFPNKVVGEVNAYVTCDKDIQSARAAMLGHDLWMGGGVDIENSRAFNVNITSPTWTPTQPLVVYIAFKNELATGCTITQR
jgi:hypothetical protein